MELRMIYYGYRKEQFKYYVVPEEAQVIIGVFKDYLQGKTLLQIAKKLTEDQVVYYKDKTVWSKNMVCRLLENEHYLGDEEYPKIIDAETFEKANKMREEKGGKREKLPPDIDFIKNCMFCDRCGGKVTRRKHYPVRERWICADGCPCTEEYLDDNALLSKLEYVLDLVRKHPEQLMYDAKIKGYEPTREIIIKEKEIRNLIFDNNALFQPIRKLIMESITLKYNAMTFDPSKAKTDVLCEYVANYKGKSSLNLKFLKIVLSKIFVEGDGNIRVEFVNGKQISNRLVIDNE